MIYLFSLFELDEENFCLTKDGQRVPLEPKSLRVLLLLVKSEGRLLEKNAILEAVWKDTFVEETTLTRAIALKGYLPHVFTFRGRRLLYSWGIYVLVFLTGSLLIKFGGVTDRLIPLYAIGAFMAFTLSQAGMVVHWKKQGGPGSKGRAFVNGLGAVATGITTVVVLVTKFTTGAWVTALLIPCLILAMAGVHRHYQRVAREMANPHPLRTANIHPPLVIIPMDRWSRIAEKAFRFAMSISPELHVVHVDTPDIDHGKDELASMWMEKIVLPLRG